ncbi:MAG: putative Ig domain-containing protein [Bordetella sp.]|nr:putative Ig domain-containing protein [Bordetella sp.]
MADGTLTIQFTDEAGAIPTQADVQNALRQVTYANGSDVPAERVAVRVTLSDQRGLESAAMAFDIDITAVNDLPVVEADPVLSLGELAAVQHLTDLAGMSALTASAASADGLTVYVADGNGAIALFSRDAGSGELTLVRVLSGTSGLDGVKALQLSADGTSLYALHENGNAIVWFSVDGDGGLTRAGAISSDYAVDGGNLFDMRDIALSADGRNLYLTNAYNVVILARDGGSGALSYVGAIEGGMWSAPYLWAPTEVVTRGDLVFVVTNTSSGSSLIVYQRDADGALTLLGNASNNGTDAAGQPVSLDGLEQLAVSADGRTIFVANGAQIDAFALDPATGALTHKGVFASNLAITDLALTADGRALFATLADGSVNYYATANGALVGSHGGMPGAGQVVLLPDGGLVVIGDGVDVLTAPPGTAPVAVIGGDPVAVAPAVKLSDAELDAAAAGAGNYQGASVTFTGNAGDSFSFLAGDGYTLGSDAITILLDGTAIATLVQTDGAATLAFTGAVTTAQANALVHRVGYSAGGDTAGTRSVSVRMNDGADESAAHLIEVIAAEPNHAPEVGAADYTPAPVAQGRPYEVVLPDTLFSDPDGDTLTWEVSGLPPGLSFDAATRTISGTTTAALADYPVQVKVSDPSGATATRTLTLEVAEAPNTEPVDSGISLAPGQPEVGAPYRYTIPAGLFTDADGDTLTWTVTGLPKGLSFDAATRTISGVATEAGQYVLTIAASDPAGAQVSRSLGLDVVVAASPPAPQPAGDAPPPLPQVQAWNVPDDTARDPAEDPALAASVARPIDAPATDATGMGGAVAPFGAPAGGSAVLLDGLLRSSLERDDRWTRGLNGVETADGKPTRLVALASPDAPALAGPGRPVTAAWHYDRDNNRQVVTLPAGLVRSSSAIAALELRMADGGALPAGVRLDAARGLITAPGLNGGQPLSLQLLVRTVDGQRLAVPILITGERQAAAAPAAPNDAHAAAHAAAHEGDLAAASKLALSVQLRQSAAQDILAQAQQLLAALGDDPAPALPAAVNEPHAGHRQASSLSVQS